MQRSCQLGSLCQSIFGSISLVFWKFPGYLGSLLPGVLTSILESLFCNKRIWTWNSAASYTHGRRHHFTEDFRGWWRGSLQGNANNFKCTGLLARKAQLAGLLLPHPGLTSKPHSKLETFLVTSKRTKSVFTSVENADCRTLRAYHALYSLLSSGRHEMQICPLLWRGCPSIAQPLHP